MARRRLLAVRRGDIDAAFNLIPEQIASLKSEKDVRLDPLKSLDFVYMALTQEPEFNKALAVKECRQAIGYAIDYDGIKNIDAGRRGPAAGALSCRSASRAPPRRSRARSASATIRPRRRSCSPRAAIADGFEFEIAYGNAAVQGVTYQDLAQKIQSDLARVGIKANLRPMDQVNLRTEYYRRQIARAAF